MDNLEGILGKLISIHEASDKQAQQATIQAEKGDTDYDDFPSPRKLIINTLIVYYIYRMPHPTNTITIPQHLVRYYNY